MCPAMALDKQWTNIIGSVTTVFSPWQGECCIIANYSDGTFSISENGIGNDESH